MTTKYVKVPDEFSPLFEKAEDVVSKYFLNRKDDPSEGTIDIEDERYILVRAKSMSISFIEEMKGVLGEDAAMNFLYSFAKVIGQNDAKAFHQKMELEDPIEKLSAGPVHFSFTGWAYVDISPESSPTPDENYLLIYDHPNTFEADSYISAEKRSDIPVCVFSSGYSAGWCKESFGLNLDAQEISCRAKGDEVCRFIMAPPTRLSEQVERYQRG